MPSFLPSSLTGRFYDAPQIACMLRIPLPISLSIQRLNFFFLDNFLGTHLSLGTMQHLTKLDVAGIRVDVKRGGGS